MSLKEQLDCFFPLFYCPKMLQPKISNNNTATNLHTLLFADSVGPRLCVFLLPNNNLWLQYKPSDIETARLFLLLLFYFIL